MVVDVINVYSNRVSKCHQHDNIIEDSRMVRINQFRSVFFVSLQQFINIDDKKNNTNNDVVLCAIGSSNDNDSRRIYAISLYDLPTVIIHYLGFDIDIYTYDSKNNRNMLLGQRIVDIRCHHHKYPEHIEMHFNHCLQDTNSAFRKMAKIIENIYKAYLKCSINNYSVSDTIDNIINQEGILEPCFYKCIRLCNACLIEMEPELSENAINWLRL